MRSDVAALLRNVFQKMKCTVGPHKSEELLFPLYFINNPIFGDDDIHILVM